MVQEISSRERERERNAVIHSQVSEFFLSLLLNVDRQNETTSSLSGSLTSKHSTSDPRHLKSTQQFSSTPPTLTGLFFCFFFWLLGRLPVKPRDVSDSVKIPSDQQSVWHLQPRETHSSRLCSQFWWSLPTSSARLHRVRMLKCVALLPWDWLISFLSLKRATEHSGSYSGRRTNRAGFQLVGHPRQ